MTSKQIQNIGIHVGDNPTEHYQAKSILMVSDNTVAENTKGVISHIKAYF